MSGQCWPTVCDAGPTLSRHWVKISCLLGRGFRFTTLTFQNLRLQTYISDNKYTGIYCTSLGSWSEHRLKLKVSAIVWDHTTNCTKKWNESGFRPPLCTYRLNWARRWLRWHSPPDTGFEIRALAVWGRARYLSVTEAPHNTNFHTWMGKKHFSFFQTAETGNRTPNSGVRGSDANHYHRTVQVI